MSNETPARRADGTVPALLANREMIDNLILKLTTAYLRMDNEQYTDEDIATMVTLWRHRCCQVALDRTAEMMKANTAGQGTAKPYPAPAGSGIDRKETP